MHTLVNLNKVPHTLVGFDRRIKDAENICIPLFNSFVTSMRTKNKNVNRNSFLRNFHISNFAIRLITFFTVEVFEDFIIYRKAHILLVLYRYLTFRKNISLV